MLQSNYSIGNLVKGGELLELVYADAKTQEQCTSVKAAKKLFGGNNALASSLLARINALK